MSAIDPASAPPGGGAAAGCCATTLDAARTTVTSVAGIRCMRLVQLVRDGAAGCYPRYNPLIRRCPYANRVNDCRRRQLTRTLSLEPWDARMVPEMPHNVMHHRSIERND